MKKTKIPDLPNILVPIWKHKAGYGMRASKKGLFHKQKILEQATTPEDPNLLKKLGIKKGEKVLAMAGYYASWASKIQKAGAKVDYSDVSKSLMIWVKKNVKVKFGKYMLSSYELIPKNPNEYDWTFTFEACGGKTGLSIAYLRSLLNKKGGILVLFWSGGRGMGSKPETYPAIVKTISKIYGAKFTIKRIMLRARRKEEPAKLRSHRVYVIRTNNKTREMAQRDLRVMDLFAKKRTIILEKETERMKLTKKQLRDSLARLNKFSKLTKYNKELIVG